MADIDWGALRAPFLSKYVSWRLQTVNEENGKGLALAYIDSRVVMKRLDEVVGPSQWQRKHSFGPNGEVLCSLGIYDGERWVWKSDGAAQTNVESEKGGLSDAFKRAAVNFGIGRYLYYLPVKWVNVEKKGRSYRIKEQPSLPGWAIPKKERAKNGSQ